MSLQLQLQPLYPVNGTNITLVAAGLLPPQIKVGDQVRYKYSSAVDGDKIHQVLEISSDGKNARVSNLWHLSKIEDLIKVSDAEKIATAKDGDMIRTDKFPVETSTSRFKVGDKVWMYGNKNSVYEILAVDEAVFAQSRASLMRDGIYRGWEFLTNLKHVEIAAPAAPYKVGDYVRCIDASDMYGNTLTLGAVYRVKDYNGVKVFDVEGIGIVRACKFELWTLRVGDWVTSEQFCIRPQICRLLKLSYAYPANIWNCMSEDGQFHQNASVDKIRPVLARAPYAEANPAHTPYKTGDMLTLKDGRKFTVDCVLGDQVRVIETGNWFNLEYLRNRCAVYQRVAEQQPPASVQKTEEPIRRGKDCRTGQVVFWSPSDAKSWFHGRLLIRYHTDGRIYCFDDGETHFISWEDLQECDEGNPDHTGLPFYDRVILPPPPSASNAKPIVVSDPGKRRFYIVDRDKDAEFWAAAADYWRKQADTLDPTTGGPRMKPQDQWPEYAQRRRDAVAQHFASVEVLLGKVARWEKLHNHDAQVVDLVMKYRRDTSS